MQLAAYGDLTPLLTPGMLRQCTVGAEVDAACSLDGTGEYVALSAMG